MEADSFSEMERPLGEPGKAGYKWENVKNQYKWHYGMYTGTKLLLLC